MSWFTRLRLYAVNTFIAVIVSAVVIDTLPQTPLAVHKLVGPWLVRLGIRQDVWNLFSPDPDRVNTHLKAEITYRDGERREWHGPEWSKTTAWQKWIRHRDVEWYDHAGLRSGAASWESWCRYIARTQRPDLPDADRGAEVRMIYQEAIVPPVEDRPWPSIRKPPAFDEGWVLTIEKFVEEGGDRGPGTGDRGP
jgi:hypothetical protein